MQKPKTLLYISELKFQDFYGHESYSQQSFHEDNEGNGGNEGLFAL